MKAMKVARFNDSLDSPALIAGTAPVPQPGRGELLIRVHAAGVTPTELQWYTTTHTREGGRRTGAILGHGTLLFDESARTCRLGSIIVDPGRRGEGLGRTLMELLKTTAYRTPTVTELTLGVIAHNSPARSLYESLGFRGAEVVRRTPMGDQMWDVIAMRQSRGHQN